METRTEYRYIQAPELRTSGGNTLVGYPAVFRQWSRDLGGFREQILPGAFTRSIKEDDVRANWGHDQQAMPLARNKSGSLLLSEDQIGLHAEIHLPPTAQARDIYESVKRGDTSSMSFAFYTRKDEWSRGGHERTLLDVSLVDVAIVNVGAYEGATISARSLGLPETAEILSYPGITPLPVSEEERERLRLRCELLRRL
jgi:Escherichia/Staphylococcus phage prohead protease